jgi:hypothetical protein
VINFKTNSVFFSQKLRTGVGKTYGSNGGGNDDVVVMVIKVDVDVWINQSLLDY